MANNDNGRQQPILRLLTSQIVGNANDVLDRASSSWHQLATHLAPFIGEAGFCALYARAVRLAHPEFTWLTLVQSSQPRQALFDAFQQNLAAADPDAAVRANTKVLEIFITLLSTLIGEALATRILNSAWVDESDARNPGEKK
jgi:hypothetical protein